MHKGSLSVPRKRKVNKSLSGDQAKKRKIVRGSGAEAQSRQVSVDNERTSKYSHLVDWFKVLTHCVFECW